MLLGWSCGVACAAARRFEADGVLAKEGSLCPGDGFVCVPVPEGGSPVVDKLGGAPVAIVNGLKDGLGNS